MIFLSRFSLEQVGFRGETLRLDILSHGVLRLMLTRARARNAINEVMIGEFDQVFEWLGSHSEEARLLLLQGEGEIFCAGADLDYMRKMTAASEEENLEDARRLGRVFHGLAHSPVPVVCHVQGAALGGGLGLTACSDYVVAQASAVFATPEVRLGLIAGVIGPFVVRKLGLGRAAPLMQMGARVSAREALQMGLAQRVVDPTEDAEDVVSQVIQSFLQAGPQATRATRELLRRLVPLPGPEVIDMAARTLAGVRMSKEAKQGLAARSTKRSPPWGREVP